MTIFYILSDIQNNEFVNFFTNYVNFAPFVFEGDSSMEPIGTITNYHQFLDEESVGIVESIMREAPNFITFVDNLVDDICTNDHTIALRYVGLAHAVDTSNQSRFEIQSKRKNLVKLRLAFADDIVVQAMTFWSAISNPTDEALMDFFNIIDDALAAKPAYWVSAILLLLAGACASLQPQAIKYLDDVKVMLDKNENLEFLKAYLHWIHGNILRQEGEVGESEKEFALALELAEKYDHKHLQAIALDGLGNIRKNVNARMSLDDFVKAYRLCIELGDDEMEQGLLFSMGLVYTILGEYDLALEARFDSIEGIKSDTKLIPSLTIARLFCDIEMGSEALEWIQWGESDAEESFHMTMWHLAKALSLIHLGRLEEADTILEASKESALKTGQDWATVDYHFVQGYYYLVRNDIHSAFDYLERALRISELMNLQIYINRCLIALTRAEIALVSKIRENTDPVSSGKWMSMLERHAKTMNYPGIRMQHAIMQADYQALLNNYDSAKETLEVALEISDSPSVITLRNKILKKIEDFDELAPAR